MEQHDPATPIPEVWPPPPTTDSAPFSRLSKYVSARRLAQIVIALMWGTIAMYAYDTLIDVSALTNGRTLGINPAIGEAIAVVSLLVSSAGFIFFLIWTYRVYCNLSAFGVQGLQYSAVWAVGGFFVPILGLYRPYQVFREIWQASDTAPHVRMGQQWQLTKVPALLPAWWVCYLATGVFYVIDSLNGPGAGLPSPGSVGPAGSLLAFAVDTLSAILSILIVRAITNRQEAAAHSPA